MVSGWVSTSAEGTHRSDWVVRFDRVERIVHWCNAGLFAVLVVTGAALYYTPLMSLIGRRLLIEHIHVYAGLAFPVPVVLSLCGSWGRALRRDLARFNRWTEADRRWFRAIFEPRGQRHWIRSKLSAGKFNAGQKLNAAFVGGAGLVMLMSGCILRWPRPFPLSWRAGATFVHNWLALAFVVVIAGHIYMALSDPQALRSMVTGRISRRWADRHAPQWLDELGEPDRPAPQSRALKSRAR